MVAALAPAPLAGAQSGSPFDYSVPPAPAQTVQQTATTNTTTQSNQFSDGLQTWQAVLIVLGGVLLLFGIAFAIMRDARSRAPVDEDEATAPQHARDAHVTARNAKRRQRQKAKAVRQQRKHNR
jgi:flagellar biosynthesis/type III secretory pathway M-ring protein FliF/YscJ